MEDARLETVAARQAHVRRSVCGERLAHKYANDLAPEGLCQINESKECNLRQIIVL